MGEHKELPKRRKTIDEKTDEFIRKMKKDLEELGIGPEEVKKLWDDAVKKSLTLDTNTDRERIYG